MLVIIRASLLMKNKEIVGLAVTSLKIGPDDKTFIGYSYLKVPSLEQFDGFLEVSTKDFTKFISKKVDTMAAVLSVVDNHMTSQGYIRSMDVISGTKTLEADIKKIKGERK